MGEIDASVGSEGGDFYFEEAIVAAAQIAWTAKRVVRFLKADAGC